MAARMVARKAPVTAAVRLLRQQGVAFQDRLYAYQEHGGTAVSARELGVDEHAVIKTLVMEDETQAPLIILMHGDREVSVRELARQAGRRHVAPCRPEVAERHTGYQVGGTSPFGTRHHLPIYAEASIRELARVYINGGKRGYLVELDPADLWRVLSPVPVSVTQA
ncbi:MAG TPA: Cys-tRNA(Pro) deacylase [Terriglobales bacterium]